MNQQTLRQLILDCLKEGKLQPKQIVVALEPRIRAEIWRLLDEGLVKVTVDRKIEAKKKGNQLPTGGLR